MRRVLARVVFVLVGLAVAAGCGVPSQSSPHVIRDAALPRDTATTRPTVAAVVDARVFFVRGNRPVPVTRRAAGSGLDDVLDALLAGPTDAEVAGGVRTTLPAGAAIGVDGVTAEGVATLDIGSLLDGVTGQEQILAFAQLVLTATDAAGVDSVTFERAGRRVEAPTVDGTLVSRPLTAGDYAPLLTGG
ncbi:MAG TPA: GerMN domain-containing protein [Acidimicrobiales bacterium]|nr:GerMN domain-containing protein [Acidimicrobiales bacterium]